MNSSGAQANNPISIQLGIAIVVFMVLLISGLMLLGSDRMSTRFVPLPVLGLTSIDGNFTIRGEVRRRLMTDTLWLPLFDSNRIYVGDSVRTEMGANMQIVFKDGSKIEILEGSLVRIQLIDGHLNFILSQGDMILKGPTKTTVQMGQTDEIKSAPGKTEVRASIGGDSGDEEKKALENEKAVTVQVTTTTTLKTGQFPYPKNQSVLLHFGKGTLVIQAAEICTEGCRLILKFNDKDWVNQEFKPMSVPRVSLPIRPGFAGKFQGSLSGAVPLEWQFELAPMTPEAMGHALKKNQQVEILEQ